LRGSHNQKVFYSAGTRAGVTLPSDGYGSIRRTSPENLRPSIRAAQFALHTFVEAGDADHDALMGATADRLALIVRLDAEADGAALDPRDLRRRGDA
jgi:hypothetical protein